MIVRAASAADITAVCRAMHPEDAEEQLAARFAGDAEEMAAELAAAAPLAIAQRALAAADGAPVAIVGAYLVAPGVATVHQVRTGRWPEIAVAAHRYYRRRFIPGVLAPNVRLAECRILESHRHARRWLQALGFRENGEPLPYGSRGEAVVHCVWVNPHPVGTGG